MSRYNDLDALLQKFVDDGLPGCSCIIARKGEILYENYFGWADIENKKPLTADNVFRQASLTKVAMYTAAMMLYEQGKFLMSDPIYEYFPEWRNTTKMVYKPNGEVDIVPVERPITVKNIMNMTCGLPYDMIMGDVPVEHPVSQAMARAMEPLKAKGHYTLREQIKAISQVPIAFEPGTRWLYGFASELTAGLLEVICGKPAEVVLKEMLFEPLGMDSSANFFFGDLEDRLVKNYYLKPGKKLGDPDALTTPPPERDAKFYGPLGAVSGFARVIQLPRLHEADADAGKRRRVQRRTDNRPQNDRPDAYEHTFGHNDPRGLLNTYLAGYGYGYGVRTMSHPYEGQHNGSLGAFGWTGGSGTWAEADPSRGVSIVYMHNLQPNLEEYHHLRMRATAYGCID